MVSSSFFCSAENSLGVSGGLMKKLAICIPNYSKQECFFRLLNQTVDQLNVSDFIGDVEICISDDVSPNDITNDVKVIINNNPNIEIKYQRLKKNKGRWGNIKEVVSMANAEYCWVIGNDDIYAHQESISIIVNLLISKNPDILTFPTILFDGEKYQQYSQLPLGTGNCKFNFTDENDFNKWHENIEWWLNYFSDPMLVLFKKELWNEYVNDIVLEDNGFGFWIVLYIMALKGSIVYYTEQFFIIRHCSDDDVNFSDCKFLYIYIRDFLVMYKYLLKTNEKAAIIYDEHTYFYCWIRKQFIMKSSDLTESEKAFLESNQTKKIKEFESRIAELKHKNVLLFGSGKGGEWVRERLEDSSVKTYNYVDNDAKRQGMLLGGIEIISPKKSLEIPNTVYVITTTASDAVINIQKQLYDMEVAEEDIVIDFIK
jgi:hypothetical protein